MELTDFQISFLLINHCKHADLHHSILFLKFLTQISHA